MYLVKAFIQLHCFIQVRNGLLGLSNGQIDSCSFEVGEIVGWIGIYGRGQSNV